MVCTLGGDRWTIGEMSVHAMGEMGKDLCPSFLQTFHEYFDRRRCNFFSISQPSTKTQTLSFGGGSYLIEVPSKTASSGIEKKGVGPYPKDP